MAVVANYGAENDGNNVVAAVVIAVVAAVVVVVVVVVGDGGSDDGGGGGGNGELNYNYYMHHELSAYIVADMHRVVVVNAEDDENAVELVFVYRDPLAAQPEDNGISHATISKALEQNPKE
uniref:Uncharacterized protein n=1 Tax=Glossina pallidipes TaxID=7398 RepID=A0A1A9ZBH7_GLOPL